MADARDRGSITAEFASVIPAVMLVLAVALAAMQLCSEQLRLQDAAAVTARALARGDPAPATPGARLTTHREGDIECARLAVPPRLPLLVEVSAQSCALR